MENKTETKTPEQEHSEHERCDKVINKALKENPYLNHLIIAMDKLGCEVTSQFFKCKPCSKPASGFFDTKLGIVMCENHPMTQKKSEDTIVHEMVHAYDHCKNFFDKTNCVHIACSEIRAQNLSGECQWTKEVGRRNFNFKKQHKECVRRRAELSLSMIPGQIKLNLGYRNSKSSMTRAILSKQIPIGSDVSTLEVAPLISENSFGIAVTSSISPSCYQYRVKIVARGRWGDEEIGTCFTWAKRSPISLETTTFNGIALRVKINHGVFDFRRINEQLIRIKVECFVDGNYLQQGDSSVLQLFPKKRKANESDDVEMTVPIYWIPETSAQESYAYLNASNSSFLISDEDEGMQLVEINSRLHEPYQASLLNSDSNSSDLSSNDSNSNTNEQYMVLYNGNAEVIGNFRALNFYKASDINIKEDVRLLRQKTDPRDTLLKIDGVDYKFKKGISHTTNKRFVGYIAQQVESVVPEAVQLIDGILHVDYESLIPYLSESIRANLNDIKENQAKTERIEKVVDMLYQQFLKQEKERLKQEQRREQEEAPLVVPVAEPSLKRACPERLNIPAGCAIIAIIALVLTSSILGVIYYSPVTHKNNNEEVPAMPYDPDLEHFQRAILLQFYTDTNGPSWYNSTEWATNTTVCTWRGIECANGDGQVTKIYLLNNNLVGTLSPSLGDLTNLTNLELMDNNLVGTIPPQLFQLKQLEVLQLANNSLIGPVPEEFSRMRSLKVLQIGFNKITKLPSSFKEMQNLKILAAQNNLLRGPLPDLSETMLVTVELSSNYFEGPLPKIPAGMKILVLSNNHLNGTIENLSDLDELQLLRLNNNTFTGDISFSPYQWYHLDDIDLSNNGFTGFKEDKILMHADAGCIATNNPFLCPLPEWTTQCHAQCKEIPPLYLCFEQAEDKTWVPCTKNRQPQ